MTANTLLTRVPRHFLKTLTFDGGSGSGAVGTVAVGTVTGRVQLITSSFYCSTSLTGASATIEMGTANNTAAIVAQTTATDLDATEFWKDATPEAEVSTSLRWINVAASIIITVGTANVTAGVIECAFMWLPMSVDGNLA